MGTSAKRMGGEISCRECGERISDRSNYCMVCGTPVESRTGDDRPAGTGGVRN